MSEEVTARSYTLRTKEGAWLGQIVLTSDGFFSAVTDYGNAAYAWRSFGGSFEDFLLKINTNYFAGKMVLGLSYTVQMSKKIEKSYKCFAEMILPALKDKIRESRGGGEE